jgi:hypothetical protein
MPRRCAGEGSARHVRVDCWPSLLRSVMFHVREIMPPERSRPDSWPGPMLPPLMLAAHFALCSAGVRTVISAGLLSIGFGLAILVRLVLSNATANLPKNLRLAASLRGASMVAAGAFLLIDQQFSRWAPAGLVFLALLVVRLVLENRGRTLADGRMSADQQAVEAVGRASP